MRTAELPHPGRVANFMIMWLIFFKPNLMPHAKYININYSLRKIPNVKILSMIT